MLRFRRYRVNRRIFFFIPLISCITVFLLLQNIAPAAAQQIPTGQDAGSLERTAEEVRKKEAVTQKLIKKKEKPAIEDADKVTPEEPEAMRVPETTTLVTTIVVNGVTVFSERKIRSIVKPYEGRELSLGNFREITDAITDLYREKGYVTTIVYLPPQRIENNTLRINVAEGKIGDIRVTGSKYFNEKILRQFITLRKEEIFNYDVLRRDLDSLNSHPDRNAKAVLARGEEQGETDINIEVKDRFPFHLTLGYDNYNSRYLNRNRYLAEVQATNFLGLDDIASGEFQMGEEGRYYLYSARYMLPVKPRWKVGGHYIHVDQTLGREVRSLDIQGKGNIVATYLSYMVVNKENLIISINPGFEYKNIENEILDTVISEDRVRIAKIGLDIDFSDRFNGRTVLTHEFDFGIPDFLDGLEDKDPMASRVGAGGKFFRTVTNVARIQALPADLSLMLRGAMQLTGDTLVASEQFHIGGFTTVRGYPVADQAGDRGYTLTAELYIPPYFLPRETKIPYTETTFFDAIRFMVFFDWGLIDNENPGVGEPDDEMLYSAGPAIRFSIPGKGSISFDYGFGLGQDGSDGTRSRYYIEAKLYF
jgi:hemolysin activation/secretion protein